MAEVYGWTSIPPDQYLTYTPAELDMMVQVQKIKAGVEEPREPMTNPEMANVCTIIEEAIKSRGDA